MKIIKYIEVEQELCLLKEELRMWAGFSPLAECVRFTLIHPNNIFKVYVCLDISKPKL